VSAHNRLYMFPIAVALGYAAGKGDWWGALLFLMVGGVTLLALWEAEDEDEEVG
jgi:hypothetical protein